MYKLKELRLKNNIKVAEVAKILEVTDTAIYYYENLKRKVPIKHLKKLTELYSCKLEDLID